MGDKLADVIVNQGGDEFFSRATFEQYSVSRQLWEQLMESNTKPTIREIFNLADFSLLRNPEWISVSKGKLASIEYDKIANIDSSVVAVRNAFDKECIGRYDEAFNIIEAEKNSNTNIDDKAKGLLMQMMAEYKNFTNPSQAQEILLSAQKLNPMVLKPICGIQYDKLQSFSESQGANIIKFIKDNNFTPNNYLIRVNSALDSLIFTENAADSFEDSLNTVASIIGIHASRPDKDGIKGSPDNLWAINNLEYFIIECKNGVKPDITTISKSDCSQLLSSIQWFENLYIGNDFKCYPIIIHRVDKFDDAASPDPRMRVMTTPLLEQFKIAVKSFAEGIAHSDIVTGNVAEIQKLLIQHRLNGKAIVDAYTKAARK